jgi:UDP-N-acetylglucosamine--N-acetylmuramyl-(pentapeptide) pyrophosphoryl-undecaprenol N-acetylglucosamine transferase
VTTGLAVIEEYRRTYPGTEAFFLGGNFGFESRLAPAHGVRLVTLPSSPFMRQGLIGRLRAGVNFLRSARAARAVLLAEAPDLVLGLGGYASAGAVLAARLLGIPTVIHEANVRPGLANRLLGPWVNRICIAWQETGDRFRSERTLLTGNPVSREIAFGAPGRPHAGSVRMILVAGGSEGSPFLNERAPELAQSVQRAGVELKVVHQSGWGDPAAIRADYAKRGVAARVEPFLDDMARGYGEADFAICCAGAVTLSELAAQGLPALLVPLATAAGNHQATNAEAYNRLTGALCASQQEWDCDRLAKELSALLAGAAALRVMSERAKAAARPEAARAIVEACEALLLRVGTPT